MRRLLVASIMLAFLFPVTSAQAFWRASRRHRPRCNGTRCVVTSYWCDRAYTVVGTERTADRIYAGTRLATRRNLLRLGEAERCQVVPSDQALVRTYDHQAAALNTQRRYDASNTPYGAWAIPASIVACESGFQNLPPNSAGASGYYQILGSTWAQWGGSPPDEAYLHSKSEQDAVAGRIWRALGNEQWVCKA